MRVSSVWALAASWPVALAATIPLFNEASNETADAADDEAPPLTEGKFFSLSLLENTDFKGIDAPSEMLKVHAKYGGSLSQGLSEAVEQNPDMKDKFKMYFQQGQSLPFLRL